MKLFNKINAVSFLHLYLHNTNTAVIKSTNAFNSCPSAAQILISMFGKDISCSSQNANFFVTYNRILYLFLSYVPVL